MKDFILYCMCNFEYDEFVKMNFEEIVGNYIENMDIGDIDSEEVSKILNSFMEGSIEFSYYLKKYMDELRFREKEEK